MNIRITGVNLIISFSTKRIIRSKFTDKLDQLLPQFNDELKTANLHIEKDKKYKNYTAKFDMSLPGLKNPIFAQTTHHELTSAIVDLREAVERQIKKYKHAD
jgi:ribosomal subunit interface protein